MALSPHTSSISCSSEGTELCPLPASNHFNPLPRFSVVTTVRSQDKASGIRRSHADVPQSRLDFVIVPDIAREGAFEEVVKSEPPFKIIIHTASPFHFNTTNPKKDLIDPAVIGTVDILKSIKKNATEVKQVVSIPQHLDTIHLRINPKEFDVIVDNNLFIRSNH